MSADDDMKLRSMRMKEMTDPRYAAGGGRPSKTMNEEEGKAAEIAAVMAGDEGDVAAKFKKKGTKSSSSSKPQSGDEISRSQSNSEEESQYTQDPPDFNNPYSPEPGTDAFLNPYRTSPISRGSRSVDPDTGGNNTIGEVWEVSRPPGLVQDGGTDHGFFYVPTPTSSDGTSFHAFLNNQKYTTRSAPCVDWRSWAQNNPQKTLIHFSDVPREAVNKGRHLLEVRPGSAFFSQTQLSIQDGGNGGYEDSGSYAQMFYLQPSRGGDADESFASASAMYPDGTLPDPESDEGKAFQEWRQRTGKAGPSQGGSMRGSGGGGGGGDSTSVSFLRRGFNQNIIAGIVAFTGPGLFNAMQGLGNAGGSDPTVGATMNAVLYGTFSFFGVMSGSLFNILGTKLLMSFGALTYGFYAISVYLWGQVDDSYAGMAIFASALLGLGAACLWGAQGTMTLSYALEHQKGLFFGIFWLIFNMGGVMGGFISMGLNSGPEDERASAISPETYFTFCALMAGGAVFAFFFVIRPSRVVKSDGSAVVFEKTDAAEGGIGELKEIANLFTNKYMLLLTPLIIQSNWFYAYEFGGINGLLFDAPTRGLNSSLYWLISGVSSYVCGTYYLDSESIGGRHQRAIKGLAMISAINVGQWIFAIAYQFSTGYDKGNSPDPLINYSDGGAYAVPALLFMYCGLADSLVQTYAYWIIGAITNSPKTLSRYVGYYKGIQSFGACMAWIIEAEGTSYRAQLLICSALAVLFIPPTYMVATCIQDKGGVVEEDFAEYSAALQKEKYSKGYSESRSYTGSRSHMENTENRSYAENTQWDNSGKKKNIV